MSLMDEHVEQGRQHERAGMIVWIKLLRIAAILIWVVGAGYVVYTTIRFRTFASLDLGILTAVYSLMTTFAVGAILFAVSHIMASLLRVEYYTHRFAHFFDKHMGAAKPEATPSRDVHQG